MEAIGFPPRTRRVRLAGLNLAPASLCPHLTPLRSYNTTLAGLYLQPGFVTMITCRQNPGRRSAWKKTQLYTVNRRWIQLKLRDISAITGVTSSFDNIPRTISHRANAK